MLVAVIVLAIGWAILLPFMHDEGGDFMNIATLILAYSVMALGLNIIVGYAGLLDLGYVAFFALGALTAGWFMSDFYANAGEGENGIHVLVADVTQNLFGIHFNFLMVVVIAIVITTIAGMLIGLPTLRLRGDYIAIVTLAFGEIIGRIVINGDQIHYKDVPILGGTLTDVFGKGAVFSGGREGIGPIDKIWLFVGDPFKALDLRPVVPRGARDGAARAVRELPAARLAPRPRLDRAARGRGRGGLDGRAARQDEAAGLRHGRRLRRHGRRVPRVALSVVNADQFQFFFSIFILAMVILGGLGSIEGVLVGAAVLVYLNFKFIPDLNAKPREWFDLDLDLSELSSAIYGFLLVMMMVLRPEGLIPERRRKLELAEHVGTGQTAGLGEAAGQDTFEARA